MRWLSFAVLLAVPCLFPVGGWAVSCTTESEMAQAQRDMYEQAARTLGEQIQTENTAAVRANTVAAVAAQFDGVAGSISQLAPLIKNAALTVDSIYNLNATDLKAGSQQAQFFCSVPGSALVVTVTVPGLPPGNYVLAVVHATGVAEPQQISLILENDPAGSAQWKLAGLYARPLTIARHDGVWYWTQARTFAGKQQGWNAYFYYQTAKFLLNPVGFFSSPNLEKLEKEAEQVRPAELPGSEPLVIKAGGEAISITGLRTESFEDELDLVVDYKTKSVSDPVATRTQIVELMKALLTRYPELRVGFHGLWVYAHGESGQPFAIELPVSQIQ